MTDKFIAEEHLISLKSDSKISENALKLIISDLCNYYNKRPTSIKINFNGKLPSVTFNQDRHDGLLNIINALQLEISFEDQCAIASWAEFCQTQLLYGRQKPLSYEVLKALNDVLRDKAYLVGYNMTPADALVYLYVYDIMCDLSLREKETFLNLCRWFNNIQIDSRLRGKRDLLFFSKVRLYCSGSH